MIIRIDARRFTSEEATHQALDEAFGFPEFYGRNWDALVDCLTDLDQPSAGMTRVNVFPGQCVLLVLDHVRELTEEQDRLRRKLEDVLAFVNGRRLERNQPPVLALAHGL